MEMNEIALYVIWGIIASEIFLLFAERDNEGATLISILFGGGLMITWYFIAPPTFYNGLDYIPRWQGDGWYWDHLAAFFAHEDHLFHFSVGWLVTASVRLIYPAIFYYPGSWFFPYLGRVATTFSVLFLIGFLFGPIPFINNPDMGIKIDRRVAWRAVQTWPGDLVETADNLWSGTLSSSSPSQSSASNQPQTSPTSSPQAKTPDRTHDRETVANTGTNTSGGPGYVGIRVSEQTIVYLIAPATVASMSGGRALVEVPLTVEVYNNSYAPVAQVSQILPDWPRIVLHAPDGTKLRDSPYHFLIGVGAASAVRGSVYFNARDSRGPGDYKLTLHVGDQSASTTFRLR
jgi:hypothetical protein